MPLEPRYSLDSPVLSAWGQDWQVHYDLIGQSSAIEGNAYTGSYRQTSTNSKSNSFSRRSIHTNESLNNGVQL
jgi:beta-glucanase (GH16 family)